MENQYHDLRRKKTIAGSVERILCERRCPFEALSECSIWRLLSRAVISSSGCSAKVEKKERRRDDASKRHHDDWRRLPSKNVSPWSYS